MNNDRMLCPACHGHTHPDESIICATCDDRQWIPKPTVVELMENLERSVEAAKAERDRMSPGR